VHRYVYRRFRRPTWIPSLMECKDTNESKKLSNRAQISCAVRARMHQGRQWTQTLRTPTVLELEDLRLDDKTIDETILSSLLRGVRRGPLRESFGAKLRAACMTAMISGPRYGSTSELQRAADATDLAHEDNTRRPSHYSPNGRRKCAHIRRKAPLDSA